MCKRCRCRKFEKLRWVVGSSPRRGNFAICQKYPTILLTQVTAIPSTLVVEDPPWLPSVRARPLARPRFCLLFQALSHRLDAVMRCVAEEMLLLRASQPIRERKQTVKRRAIREGGREVPKRAKGKPPKCPYVLRIIDVSHIFFARSRFGPPARLA